LVRVEPARVPLSDTVTPLNPTPPTVTDPLIAYVGTEMLVGSLAEAPVDPPPETLATLVTVEGAADDTATVTVIGG
jgi:hypothetical protein